MTTARPTFTRLESRLAPLPIENVDTDQIIPARYLKVTDKSGLGEGLFSAWRTRADGSPDPDFVLNRPEHTGAEILLAGDNFGCGSSREHAPWALLDHGFRAVVCSSFADIFRSNSLKNGLLLVEVPAEVLKRLFEVVAADPGVEATVDLEAETLFCGDLEVPFPIDAFSKHCLLHGVDQLGYLLDQAAAIEAFEAGRPDTLNTLA
ncbi:MAG: 3-isopropylmalate dehydratase small subunit [Thermoanaerobaculia bacterium]|nr:3-isopropylmalate dehydratase small subunit [Thermoanaerobaculia bacterium]